MRKDIKKVIDRVDFDKTIDSCGFEFADGYSCTFDNIATCYDDRLKLSAYVEQLQRENERLKNNNNPLKGIFAGVNDDMLLRDLGNLSAENQLLKKKYENAVADYEYEHHKNQKAINYIINNFDFDNETEKLFEILKGDKEWKIK